MKRIRIPIRLKIPNFIIPPISYPTAFGISVILHAMALLLFTFLLAPIKPSHSPDAPLVIDFVSFPGAENERAASRNKQENSEQYFSRNAFNNPPSQPTNLNCATTSEQQEQVDSEYADVNDHGDIFDGIGYSKYNEKYIASIFTPNALKFPRLEYAQPALVPAKIAVSQKQEIALEKMLMKFTEKFNKMELSDTTFCFEHKKQVFEARFTSRPAQSPTSLDELIVAITTEKDGATLSTQLRMRRLAFSNFAQLVDFWDPQVAVHDDEFEGRFHTNYAFAISRSKGIGPKFHGKVTTAAVAVKTSGEFPIIDEASIFIGGIETGVKQIRLPKNFSLFSRRSALPREMVHCLCEETWITFAKDGSYVYKNSSSSFDENRKRMPGESFFIIGEKGAKIHVKGTVKGKVLVCSADDIIIDGNLYYARPPDKFAHSDDYLGLVSERDVEIAHPAVTGAGDLTVYAAIYAKGWFRIPHRYGADEATLFIYGSLSAGSLTATEPRYATRIHFDKRLETQRPPNFPMTENYEIVEWDKVWTVKN